MTVRVRSWWRHSWCVDWADGNKIQHLDPGFTCLFKPGRCAVNNDRNECCEYHILASQRSSEQVFSCLFHSDLSEPAGIASETGLGGTRLMREDHEDQQWTAVALGCESTIGSSYPTCRDLKTCLALQFSLSFFTPVIASDGNKMVCCIPDPVCGRWEAQALSGRTPEPISAVKTKHLWKSVGFEVLRLSVTLLKQLSCCIHHYFTLHPGTSFVNLGRSWQCVVRGNLLLLEKGPS